MNKKIYGAITDKKELSQLPKQDVEKAFSKFKDKGISEKEKIRRTRKLLNNMFWPFRSHKLLGLKNKDKDPDWILRKHMSSRERLSYYNEVYERIFNGFEGDVNVFDLGSGINGFSYKYFPERVNVYYIGIEAVGQLVDLTNYYFKTRGLQGMSIHESLFNLDKIEKYFRQVKGKKILFLFKSLDSLEMLERDYSKKLLKVLTPLVDRVVVSFATKSMISKKDFKVTRKWLTDFINEKFEIIDDFEIGGERYIVFEK